MPKRYVASHRDIPLILWLTSFTSLFVREHANLELLPPVKRQECPIRIRFYNGYWRYSCPVRKSEFEISGLMRKHGYQRDLLARTLGLSGRSFHRLVKDSLGITPGTWLRQERAVAARYRLRGGASVKELAFEFGFKHPGDFTKEFKYWHGASPRAVSAVRPIVDTTVRASNM